VQNSVADMSLAPMNIRSHECEPYVEKLQAAPVFTLSPRRTRAAEFVVRLHSQNKAASDHSEAAEIINDI